MTTHHLTTEEINAWIDGYGSADELSRVEAHVRECVPCRAEAESLRQTKAMFGSLRDIELPRSFALPASMAKPMQPLASPSSRQKAGVVKFEPVLRILSIAAVLLFIAVGGLNVSGVFDADQEDSLPAATQSAETDSATGALQVQEQPQLERGEVAEQGEAAIEGSAQLPNAIAHVDTPAQAIDNGLTPLEITTAVVGVAALVLIASWILIRYRAGISS